MLLPLLLPGLATTFCLSFVQAFSVFPSAVLLGAPAGPTRVISIAAYEAAFEHYDYPMASAIAMIMASCSSSSSPLVLAARGLLYRGSTGGGRADADDPRHHRSAARLWAAAVWAAGRLLRPQPARA